MKEYLIDFGSWILEAENEEDARKKAIDRIGWGDFPDITNVEADE